MLATWISDGSTTSHEAKGDLKPTRVREREILLARTLAIIGVALFLVPTFLTVIGPAQAIYGAMDQSWMRRGERLEFRYEAPGTTPFTFRIYVASVTATRLEFRWQFEEPQLNYVASTWMAQSDRSRVDAPTFADFIWITPTEADDGTARIGNENAVVVQSSLTQVTFQTPRARYTYDALTGILREASDVARGVKITMVSRTPGLSVPEPTPRPIVDMQFAEMSMESASSPETPAAIIPKDRLRLQCAEVTAFWSGLSTTWCDAPYYTYSGEAWANPALGWDWDLLTYAKVVVVVRDGVNDVGLWECASAGPYLKDDRQMATCPGNRVQGVLPVAGTHTMRVSADVYGCLDPLSVDSTGAVSPFTCTLTMAVETVGRQLACVGERPADECIVRDDF